MNRGLLRSLSLVAGHSVVILAILAVGAACTCEVDPDEIEEEDFAV